MSEKNSKKHELNVSLKPFGNGDKKVLLPFVNDQLIRSVQHGTMELEIHEDIEEFCFLNLTLILNRHEVRKLDLTQFTGKITRVKEDL